MGDGALAEFGSTEAAASSAMELVEEFHRGADVRLRVGLHVGDVVRQDDGDLMGDGVNLASRLQAEAEPGEVLVSESAWQQLRHREGYRFRAAGRRHLKGQPDPVRVFTILVGGAGADESTPPADAAGSGLSGRLLWSRVRAAGAGLLGRASDAVGRRPYRVHLSIIGVTLLVALTALFGGGWGQAWFSGLMALLPGAQSDVRPTAGERVGFDPARLAVLYFDDHSPGGQLEYLADGLTEGLIHELTQVEALDVISRNGVKPFQDGDTRLDSIVSALQVGTVVEGSVALRGDRVRVTVQLVDGATGSHIDSRELDYPAVNLLAIEDGLVDEVAELLRRALGQEIWIREIRRGTSDSRAYELLLRAQSLREDYGELRLEAGGAARRTLRRADSLLAEAQARDPRWAEPVLLRGWYARELSLLEAPLAGRLDTAWSEQALAYADRAIGLGSSGGYELRGLLRYELSRDARGEDRVRLRAAAEADLQQALSLDDRRARAWLTLSDLFLSEGRFPEAVLAAERSLQEDAFLGNAENVLHQIYITSLQFGPTEEARRACAEGRRRFPRSDEFLLCGLFVLASYPDVPPDVDRAWALTDSLVAVVPSQERSDFRAYGTMLVAEVAARAGLADSARAIIRLAYADGVHSWLLYNEAHARLLMGEDEEAVRLLARSLAVDPDTAMLAKDWWFDNLHSNEEFRALLGRFAGSQPSTGESP